MEQIVDINIPIIAYQKTETIQPSLLQIDKELDHLLNTNTEKNNFDLKNKK